ncbi:hypothetical protein PHMEG_00023584 [Phytophthora megakarya]|uniref:Uncharacterized protein n=1 Tax=Phytophthora megakarya TaxID=4795 RepID=A0A225VIZ7_9STRA|nr:hypothetical protein PHMEG_00023584 [Phytophthora megakarya]
MRVEGVGKHVSPSPSSVRHRLTPLMKNTAREWAIQGLKPARIRTGFLRRFNLSKESLPPLSVVLRFVHNYSASHLRNNDILESLKAKIHEVAVTGNEKGSEVFALAWENDMSGRPIVGNGTDLKPFIIDGATKTLPMRANRDPVAYLVLDIGGSDKMRGFHLVATIIMSQQMQLHHSRALTAMK